MSRMSTDCHENVVTDLVSYTWAQQKFSSAQDFGGIETYSSRWLYPFALLLQERPELNDKCLFLSDTHWFDKLYPQLSLIDLQSWDIDHYYRPSWLVSQRYFIPQKLKLMLSVLNPKSRKLKYKLKEVLYKLFRTTSRIRNILGHFLEYSSIPYRDLDIFVKISKVNKHPNLVKVSLGGLFRPTPIKLFELICAIKFSSYCESTLDPRIIQFYKAFYQDKKRLFNSTDLPCMFTSNLTHEYKPVCILETYVDLTREHFLQETFLGRCVFSWFNRKVTSSIIPHLYPRSDLPKLEEYCKTRFPSYTQALGLRHVSCHCEF